MSLNVKRDIVRLPGDMIDLCVMRTDDEAITKYLCWMNDPEINHWLGRCAKVLGIAEESKWVEKERNGMLFNIVTKDNRELVGNCDIELHEGTRNACLGICIGEKKARDRGYGSEAMVMLVKFGFENLNCHRLYLNAKASNARAIRCYEKAGFKQCATFHETDFWEGKYWDSIQMEILEQDYYALKKRLKEGGC